MRRASLLALLLAACGSPATSHDGGADDLGPDATPPPDDAATDGARPRDGGPPPPPTPTGMFPDHAHILPFSYDRPDVGTPVTPAELATETDHYLALLDRVHWFDYVEQRVHGWPESDPSHPFYATWWSGCGIDITGGHRQFTHVDVGAENNGLRTPQLMEGACYGYLLWHNAQDQHLVRRLMRGLSSWPLAMQRTSAPETGLTCRAAYPVSVHDDDRDIQIFYDPNRPGVDGGASYFVHVPDNPSYGDLYVQAKRSKDDMGHVMRGIAAMDACDGAFTEAGAQDDLVQMRMLYQQWAQRVESDGFHIGTYDTSLNVVFPTGDLATYFIAGGVECHAEIAIRLLSRNDPLGATCPTPTGIVGDPSPAISSSSMQILRSHHEAAAALALVTNNPIDARDYVGGLASRIEMILDTYDSGTIPANAAPADVVQLIVESANLGVPLTSREVRWLHGQIEMAYAGYDTSGPDWHVFDPGAPDGAYAIEPNGPGIDVKDLALLLGTCVSPYRNHSGRPVLDCARVAAYAR